MFKVTTAYFLDLTSRNSSLSLSPFILLFLLYLDFQFYNSKNKESDEK